jgi:hypothetical protein
MTDRFTRDAGSYVLGALPPDERHAFEAHLASCQPCQADVREFAGLPGLLSRLPAKDVPTVLEAPEDRPGLMPSLLVQARRERRARRWRAVGVAAAAACVAAAGTGVVVAAVERTPEPAQQVEAARVAFQRVRPDLPVTATATLTDTADGLAIDMRCRYEGASRGWTRQYSLVVVGRDTSKTPMASWQVRPGEEYRIGSVAPLPRDRIDHFAVLNSTGNELLTLRP